MSAAELDESRRVEFVKTLALAGGEAIRGASRGEGVREKAGRGNLITDADRASEQAILGLLTQTFPQDQVLSEESRPTVAALEEAPHLWVIDPLDGTNNYRFGRQYAVVSVAYVKSGVAQAGAAYDPFRDEFFFAAVGQGAFRNDEHISVGSTQHLSSASVATDNCYQPLGTKRNLELCLSIQPCPWILIRGSAVLGMCEVACGRTDVYFHTALEPWDNAAAFLIAREAGGHVVGLDGEAVDFLASAAIVGNYQLVQQCQRWFEIQGRLARPGK